jgi:hypothetical protein
MNKWFAIFKTGKHKDSNGNEKEWTEADLDKIVESYDKTKHEAPIVIGHPKTNAPAFGWIEKLKRVGDTLYALPSQLAQEFVDMVKKGLFKKRSISLYPDGTLRHVGFLGAQPPAVKGLPDVEFKEDDVNQTIETELTSDYEEQDTNQKDIIENLQKKIENYEQQISQLVQKEKEFEEIQTKYAQILVEKKQLEGELEKQKTEKQLKEYNEMVDRLLSEGKLLPKMKDSVLKLFQVLSHTPVIEFSEGEKTQPVELLKEFVESMPKIIDFGQNDYKKPEKDSQPVSKIIADEIRKQMGS